MVDTMDSASTQPGADPVLDALLAEEGAIERTNNRDTTQYSTRWSVRLTDCGGRPGLICNQCRTSRGLAELPVIGLSDFDALVQSERGFDIDYEGMTEAQQTEMQRLIAANQVQNERIQTLMRERNERTPANIVQSLIDEAIDEARTDFCLKIVEFSEGCPEGKRRFINFCELEDVMPRETVTFTVTCSVPTLMRDNYDCRNALNAAIDSYFDDCEGERLIQDQTIGGPN